MKRVVWGLIAALVIAGAGSVSEAASPGEAAGFRYDGHGRRDPFEPLISPTGELRTPRMGGITGSLHVEGILWDPVQPLVIINGAICKVGQAIEGYHIVEIRHGAIVVDGGQGPTVIAVDAGAGGAAH